LNNCANVQDDAAIDGQNQSRQDDDDHEGFGQNAQDKPRQNGIHPGHGGIEEQGARKVDASPHRRTEVVVHPERQEARCEKQQETGSQWRCAHQKRKSETQDSDAAQRLQHGPSIAPRGAPVARGHFAQDQGRDGSERRKASICTMRDGTNLGRGTRHYGLLQCWQYRDQYVKDSLEVQTIFRKQNE